MTHRTRITAALLGLLGSAAPALAFGGKHFGGGAVVAAPVATVATVQTTTVAAAPAALVAVPTTQSHALGGHFLSHRSAGTTLGPVVAMAPLTTASFANVTTVTAASGQVIHVPAAAPSGLFTTAAAPVLWYPVSAAAPVDAPAAAPVAIPAAAPVKNPSEDSKKTGDTTPTKPCDTTKIVERLGSLETKVDRMEATLILALATRSQPAVVVQPALPSPVLVEPKKDHADVRMGVAEALQRLTAAQVETNRLLDEINKKVK